MTGLGYQTHVDPLAAIGVLEKLARALPSDLASFSVADVSGGSGRELIASLTPTKPTCAQILVHAQQNVPVVDVVLGRGGFFEVPLDKGRYTSLEPLDEIRSLCLAAVKGRYRETVWEKGGDVVQSHGVAVVGSREIPVHWRQLFTTPLRRARKKTFSYEAYAEVEP